MGRASKSYLLQTVLSGLAHSWNASLAKSGETASRCYLRSELCVLLLAWYARSPVAGLRLLQQRLVWHSQQPCITAMELWRSKFAGHGTYSHHGHHDDVMRCSTW